MAQFGGGRGSLIFIAMVTLLLGGCGGMDTAKPVYQGLLADGVSPKLSARQLTELGRAPNMVIVLSESTRATIKDFKDEPISKHVKGAKDYPVDEWVIDIVGPLRKINASSRIAPDLNTRAKDAWVIVVHWTALFQPFKIGGGVGYHVLDPDLAQVGVFQASDTGNCDSLSLNAVEATNNYTKCYDAFLRGLIQKASSPLLSGVGR